MGPRGRRMRRRGLVVGGLVGASVARNRANNDQQADDSQAQDDQAAVPAESDMAAQLEELQKLKTEGIITDEEFAAKKKQILGL